MPTLIDVGCSGLAGLLARVPCHPLDTMKTVAAVTEKKTQGSTSPLAVGREIYQREGIKGFYRGVGVAGFGAMPGVALYITTYEAAKEYIGQTSGNADSPLVHLAAGFVAEAVSCVVWLPIDVVKERLQSQGPDVAHRYSGSIDGLVRVAKFEGVRGLYKGYFLTLGSFGPFSACYFAGFEAYKRMLFGLDSHTSPTGGQAFLCGALANSTGCIVTQPLEVVKTRVQIQRAKLTAGGAEFDQFSYAYKGMADGIRSIVRDHGVVGLWRGTISRIAFTAPNAAISFGLYNHLKTRFASRANDQ